MFTTDVTSGAGDAYPSGAPCITPALVFSVVVLFHVCLSFLVAGHGVVCHPIQRF